MVINAYLYNIFIVLYNIQYGNSHLNIYTIMLKPILRQINLLKCYSEKVEE